MSFDERCAEYLGMIEPALAGYFGRKEGLPFDGLLEAMDYSLMAGGKRLRPMLVLEFCRVCGGDVAAALPAACAVEMLHTYSLIHDDLPCMDDDDLRRGRPSCHKAFGEATALLAGDVLLTEAFEAATHACAAPEVCLQAAQALSRGAGSRGMVYGQELDLKYEVLDPTESQLMLIHHNKTGALINAAVQMGAAAAGATEAQREALEQYAYGLGLVFQIVDDVLDATATTEQLGKPAGSDKDNGKTTFVTLYGPDGAMTLAQQVNQDTCEAVHTAFGEKAAFLEQLAAAMLERRS